LGKLTDCGAKKKTGSKKNLPLIKCLCGYEILLVPDVKVMNDAIDAHVATHIQKLQDSAVSKAESERISNYLIAQIFKKASNS